MNNQKEQPSDFIKELKDDWHNIFWIPSDQITEEMVETVEDEFISFLKTNPFFIFTTNSIPIPKQLLTQKVLNNLKDFIVEKIKSDPPKILSVPSHMQTKDMLTAYHENIIPYLKRNPDFILKVNQTNLEEWLVAVEAKPCLALYMPTSFDERKTLVDRYCNEVYKKMLDYPDYYFTIDAKYTTNSMSWLWNCLKSYSPDPEMEQNINCWKFLSSRFPEQSKSYIEKYCPKDILAKLNEDAVNQQTLTIPRNNLTEEQFDLIDINKPEIDPLGIQPWAKIFYSIPAEKRAEALKTFSRIQSTLNNMRDGTSK